MNEPPLILASASPRRIDMLRTAGVPHAVHPAGVDETPQIGEAPHDLARRVSRLKAEAVAPLYPGRAVLAADTVVFAGGCTLGKPPHDGAARQMLLLLSGATHQVVTAYCLLAPGPGDAAPRLVERVLTTEVDVRPLREADIAAYVASDEWRGKAGGYAIQGRFAAFVRAVRGSYDGVVGLPLCQVLEDLLEAGLLPPGWPAWRP